MGFSFLFPGRREGYVNNKNKSRGIFRKEKGSRRNRVSHEKIVDFYYNVAQWVMQKDTLAKLKRKISM